MVKGKLPKRNRTSGTGLFAGPCDLDAGPRYSNICPGHPASEPGPTITPVTGFACKKTARLFVQAGGRIDVGSYGGIKPGVEIGAGLR
jgi:hypothetical protein